MRIQDFHPVIRKRVTPESLQSELKKLNTSIDLDYASALDKETKKIDNRIAEMQKRIKNSKTNREIRI